MYVCLCNGITDSQLVEAAVESSSGSGGSRSSAERVADRLGAGLGCGTCRTFAIELVERAAGQTAVVLPAQVREPAGFDAAPGSPDDGALRVSPARKRDAGGDLRAESPT
jgi:bacterioferritin-associated ferredoxin